MGHEFKGRFVVVVQSSDKEGIFAVCDTVRVKVFLQRGLMLGALVAEMGVNPGCLEFYCPAGFIFTVQQAKSVFVEAIFAVVAEFFFSR
jgi:hypothetical protein